MLFDSRVNLRVNEVIEFWWILQFLSLQDFSAWEFSAEGVGGKLAKLLIEALNLVLLLELIKKHYKRSDNLTFYLNKPIIKLKLLQRL